MVTVNKRQRQRSDPRPLSSISHCFTHEREERAFFQIALTLKRKVKSHYCLIYALEDQTQKSGVEA